MLAHKNISYMALYRAYNLCLLCTGPCFDNNRRPMGSDDSAPQLECDDDNGNFEARQRNDRQHWCVSPMNGMEIPGTRRNRSMRLDCIRMGKPVYVKKSHTHTHMHARTILYSNNYTSSFCSISELPDND